MEIVHQGVFSVQCVESIDGKSQKRRGIRRKDSGAREWRGPITYENFGGGH